MRAAFALPALTPALSRREREERENNWLWRHSGPPGKRGWGAAGRYARESVTLSGQFAVINSRGHHGPRYR